jgi:GT2 family glycosyltransferase
MKPIPLLTVIIVNYYSERVLPDCLARLYAALPDISVEVFIVSNGASHDQLSSILSNYPDIHHIENEKNIGFAAANNWAIRASTGAYILLLNPDVTLDTDCLSTLMAVIEASADMGVVGPRLVLPDGLLDSACHRLFPTPADALFHLLWLDRLLPNSRFVGHYNMAYQDPQVSCDADAVSGAAMLLRRAAIEQVGLLDERFFLYAEDLDWCYRFRLAGWRVHYCAQAQATHIKRTSLSTAGAVMIRRFYHANWQLYRKYYMSERITLLGAVTWLLLKFRLYAGLASWRKRGQWL